MSLVYMLGAILVWMLVGCVILATIDRRGALLAWSKEAPYGLGCFVVALWPIVAVAFLAGKGKA